MDNPYGLMPLCLATLAFVASHFAFSCKALRPLLVERLGPGPFRLGYSLVALACFVWMVSAYADAPFVPLWGQRVWTRWLALIVMVPAAVLLAGALNRSNPTLLIHKTGSFNPQTPGIFGITRHPMMWGIGLLSIVHILATGDLAAIILFGGMALLALAGTLSIDARKKATDAALWAELDGATSNLPLLAWWQGRAKPTLGSLARPIIGGLLLWAVLLAGHQSLIGVSALP